MSRQLSHSENSKMSTRRSSKSEGVSSRQKFFWGQISLPAEARSEAKSVGRDIFRKPINNFERLSERAKTRNRQTQITRSDTPFKVWREEGDWALVELYEGTFGWLPSKQLKRIKTYDYWKKIKFAEKNKLLPSPALDRAKVDKFLAKHKGIPYLWGGTTKHGMDCSAFTQKLFHELYGILLPRNSREQKKYGKAVHLPAGRQARQQVGSQFCPLDILFFVHSTTGRHHVGVYWNGEVWHFCLDKKGLSTESLVDMQKRYRHIATRRIIQFKSEKKEAEKSSEILERIKAAKNIHVIGISGIEGAAIALFLQKLKVNFVAHDFSSEARFKRNFKLNHFNYQASKREKMLEKLLADKSQVCFAETYLKDIAKADLIFVSQNWEAYSPNRKLQRIFAKNPTRFATITQLYFSLFPGKIIAVTGTNGKSTTTKLIADIMLSSRHVGNADLHSKKSSRQKSLSNVYFTGNDRRNRQVLDSFDKWSRQDWLVIEVSNRQLKFPFRRAPDIGVITNVSPNHLGEYTGGFSAYKRGKFELIAKQQKDQIAILNYDNPTTRQFIRKIKSTPLPYSTKSTLSTQLSNSVYLKDGWIVANKKMPARRSSKSEGLSTGQNKIIRICPLDKINILGEHNLSNTLAAVAATRSAGVSKKIICATIQKFRGIPQRFELLFEKNGVRYVNDSASTTPESTVAAIESFEKGTVSLICGGDSKGMDYQKLVNAIRKQKVHVIALKSPLAEILKKELQNNFKIVETLQEAVKIAAQNAAKGDAVLLSPAAAWFCYFSKKIPLGGRGFEQFAKLVNW